MDQHDCPFCRLATNRIQLESEFALALLDAFPVAQGHTLVIRNATLPGASREA
jgi:diadenosine tetraphosphate (Ap4A) HIT family hydrolase